MNTVSHSQEMFSLNSNKWLFVTILFVALSGFASFFGGILVFGLNFIPVILMCLFTSLSSAFTQVVIIRGDLDIKIFDWLVWPLVGNIIGWMLSLLVISFVYFLFQLANISVTDEAFVLEKLYAAPLPIAALLGMLGGAAIGLPPGIFSGLAYGWLFRPVYNGKQLVERNVMGWCVGMGLVFASLLMVYVIIARAMTSIFSELNPYVV